MVESAKVGLLCSSTVDIQCEAPFRFHCDNNRCIYSHELCNSVDDCGDGSDERQENCKYTFFYSLLLYLNIFTASVENHHVSPLLGQKPTHGPCTDDEYKCSNGQCIPLQYACDDYDDCGDQSDELGCRK